MFLLTEELTRASRFSEVGTCRHVRESLLVPSDNWRVGRLLQMPLLVWRAHSMPPLADRIMEPQHLAQEAALARPRQKAADPSRLALLGPSQRMRERKGPFPLKRLPPISFPYRAWLPGRFSTSSAILQRQPEQVAETIEAVEVPELILAVGGKRPDPHRVNEAVPGLFFSTSRK